jgi:hypothetical protein
MSELDAARQATLKEAAKAKAKEEKQAALSLQGLGIPSCYTNSKSSLTGHKAPGAKVFADWVRTRSKDAFATGHGLFVEATGTVASRGDAEELTFLLGRALILSGQTVRVFRLVEFMDQVIVGGLSRFDDTLKEVKGLVLLDFLSTEYEMAFTARELMQAEAWLRRWLYDDRGLVTFDAEFPKTRKSIWTPPFTDFLERRLAKAVINNGKDIFLK